MHQDEESTYVDEIVSRAGPRYVERNDRCGVLGLLRHALSRKVFRALRELLVGLDRAVRLCEATECMQRDCDELGRAPVPEALRKLGDVRLVQRGPVLRDVPEDGLRELGKNLAVGPVWGTHAEEKARDGRAVDE